MVSTNLNGRSPAHLNATSLKYETKGGVDMIFILFTTSQSYFPKNSDFIVRRTHDHEVNAFGTIFSLDLGGWKGRKTCQ